MRSTDRKISRRALLARSAQVAAAILTEGLPMTLRELPSDSSVLHAAGRTEEGVAPMGAPRDP